MVMDSRLVVAAFATLLVGCDGATKLPKPNVPKVVTGTYALQTVDGHQLPITLYQAAADKFELLSGTLTLADEWEDRDPYGIFLGMVGTFVLKENVRHTENGSVSIVETYEGLVYSRRDERLTIGGSLYGPVVGTGTVSGSMITFVRDAHTNVYSR
jgi:hypothetical protein